MSHINLFITEEDDEWMVKYYRDGFYMEGPTYYTSDVDDAMATAEAMRDEALVQGHTVTIELDPELDPEVGGNWQTNPYYHRSFKPKFDAFSDSEMRMGDYGPGYYFSEDDSLKQYGHNLYTVELDIKNPLNVEDASQEEIDQLIRYLQLNDDAVLWDYDMPPAVQIFGLVQTLWDAGMGYKPKAVIARLKKLGYDGIIVPSKGYWVVFDPEQIVITDHQVSRHRRYL